MTRKRDTFRRLAPELRDALAAYIRRARRKDRQSPELQGWVSQSRGMQEYFFCLGIMSSHLEAWLVQRSIKEDVRVFEAGIGDFVFGRELLQRYGEWLRIEGMRLSYSQKLKGQAGLRQRVGMMETAVLNGPFDLAISARGAFVYSLNSFATTEVLVNSLKPGGMAYIDDAKLLLPHRWFRNYLRKKGIEVEITRFERGGPYAYRLERKSRDNLDLSAFAQRYVEGLDENGSQIGEWGFDRTLRGSPLTETLSSLYSEERFVDLTGPIETLTTGDSSQILEIGGVTYVNDAFSQSLEQVESAIARWPGRRIHWIAGGEGELSPKPNSFSVYSGLFFGRGAQERAAEWSKLPNQRAFQELKNTVERAYQMAKPGDVVLFSPGLAPEPEIHGTCENRATDFSSRLRELRDLAFWEA